MSLVVQRARRSESPDPRGFRAFSTLTGIPLIAAILKRTRAKVNARASRRWRSRRLRHAALAARFSLVGELLVIFGDFQQRTLGIGIARLVRLDACLLSPPKPIFGVHQL